MKKEDAPPPRVRGTCSVTKLGVAANCMRKTMNRDANAALNILHVFTETVGKNERPPVFTRAYQTDLVRASAANAAPEKRARGG